MSKRKSKSKVDQEGLSSTGAITGTALAGGANTCCAPVASSAKLWIEGSALRQLETVQGLRHVRAVAGLPDLHPGRGIPIGAAVLTQGGFYPHIAGNDLGCGVSVWIVGNIESKKLKKLDVGRWEDTQVDEELLVQALAEVHRAHEQCPSIGDGQVEQVDDEVKVPSNALIDTYLRQLGTIGGGNHFVELTRVGAWSAQGSSCYEQLQQEYGYPDLPKGTYVMLIHSGSRGMGELIASLYLDYAGTQFASSNSKMGRWFWRNQHIAHQFARANRWVLAQRLIQALGGTQGHMLLDSWHNGIEKVPGKQADGWIQAYNAFMHTQGHTISTSCDQKIQDDFYLHRKGASSAHLPLNVLPSARGQNSYLIAPNREQSSFLGALAHGAGRKWLRSDAKERLGHLSFRELLGQGEYKSVIANKALVYEEAPQAYKNIDTVLKTLVEHQMAQPVCTLEPILTIKA